MIKRTLKEIQEMVQGTGLNPQYETKIATGVTIDSRNVTTGNIYIPIIGERVDGHIFAKDAVASGASVVFWQADHENKPTDIPVILVENTEKALQQLSTAYRDQLNMKIVGITGSNGKTSTKDILASILGAKFRVHKTLGNYNSEYGMPITILSAAENTEIAVLEMGMQGLGQIELLSNIARPDAAIITNIGEAHIQDLGSRENISIAKMEIISGLKDDGIFLYHGDEPLLTEKVAKLQAPYKIETFGAGEPNDFYPTSMNGTNSGTIFTIPQSNVEFHLSVLGKHNVFNTLAAMGVARYFGLTFEEMAKGLENLQMTKMRMETLKTPSGATIINDAYNASPASAKAGLDLLHTLTGYNRKIAVLGDMLELGENEVAYHEEVGAYINPQEVEVIYTYGNLGKHIAEKAQQCKVVKSFTDKGALIADLKENITAEDIVYVKASRGMKLEEVVEGLMAE